MQSGKNLSSHLIFSNNFNPEEYLLTQAIQKQDSNLLQALKTHYENLLERVVVALRAEVTKIHSNQPSNSASSSNDNNSRLEELFFKIQRGDFLAVKTLVQTKQVKANQRSGNGETPLTCAISAMNWNSVKFLVLEAGVDVNLRGRDNTLPLMRAAFNFRFELRNFSTSKTIFDFLVERGAKWDWDSDHSNRLIDELERLIKHNPSITEEARAILHTIQTKLKPFSGTAPNTLPSFAANLHSTLFAKEYVKQESPSSQVQISKTNSL